MHSKDFLATELRKIGLEEMAIKAETGYYHDYLSPLDDPALTLYTDLSRVGTREAFALRKRHFNGEFDATFEESEEWAASAEGQAAFSRLLRGT